jgi:hypothetical protein
MLPTLRTISPRRGGSAHQFVYNPYGRTRVGTDRRSFMGKTWNGTGAAFNVETWQAALRVLKPGGHPCVQTRRGVGARRGSSGPPPRASGAGEPSGAKRGATVVHPAPWAPGGPRRTSARSPWPRARRLPPLACVPSTADGTESIDPAVFHQPRTRLAGCTRATSFSSAMSTLSLTRTAAGTRSLLAN